MKKNLNSQSGQVAVEMILLLVLLVSIAMFTFRSIQQRNFLGTLVNTPMNYLKGMVENGVWDANYKETKQLHPNFLARHNSLEGDL